MDPALQELIESTLENQDIEVILKLSNEDRFPSGVKIITQFGNIATCRIKRESIENVWSSESVASVKAPRYLDSEPAVEDFEAEIATEALGEKERFDRTHQVTGKGVIVAILDWGCDFAHPNFRYRDGSTRLLALWDQSTGSSGLNKYGYGQIYTRDDLNRALAAEKPYESLGYHPAKSDPFGNGTHGTAVMDIAAGNGLAGNSPVGIAPEADLIFVHLDAGKGTSGLLANLGDSVRLLEALDFVVETAGEQPWVANLSLGRTGGEHTGRSLVEQGMDELLSAAPGRSIVQSTGNYYQAKTHASDRLLPNRQRSLSWLVSPSDVTPNELEIWYPGSDRFLVKLRPPHNRLEFEAALGSKVAIKIDGHEVGRLYHRERDPNNHDNHIDIFLDRDAPAGLWEVILVGEDVVDGRFHAWIERDFGRSSNQSRFDLTDAVPSYTTNTICNGRRTIAVGAYDQHSLDLRVAPFSSSGPTRDGRLKPDILAPGVRIVAARSTPHGAIPRIATPTIKSGTSFAAPQVTGAIALLFEAVAPKKLSITETRNIVLGNCDRATNHEPWRVGNGYLNIKRILDSATEGEQEATSNITSPQVTANIEQELSMNSQDIYSEAQEPTVEFFDEELRESSTKRNLILISGGPGLVNVRDKVHDQGWANYVTPPLLMSDGYDDPKNFPEKDEEVWWFVYQPAYIRRWEDDVNKKRKSVHNDIISKGFSSYTDKIEYRAKERGWNLRWLNSAAQLWSKLATFNDPIARVWYWGHASTDLWLSLRHNAKDEPVPPAAHEIITVDSIRANAGLKQRFKDNSNRLHRFIGCNTDRFAKAWTEVFDVRTEGFRGFVQFDAIHKTGGEPRLVGNASIKRFSPVGLEETTREWEEDIREELDIVNFGEGDSDLVAEEIHNDLDNIYTNEELAEDSTTNFILLSGGPGLFDNRDVEHDRSWANYVTPPLLMTKTLRKLDPKKLKEFENGQEVWWLIYRPAYIRRWEDDLKRKPKEPKRVKAQGFNSYLELLEARAKARSWNLRWFDTADELWSKLKTFNDPIARFWYWGHARDGLWLSLTHSSSAVAMAPASHEIITVASIKANASLKKQFQAGSSSRVHRFIGCNTTQFAKTWAKTFGVFTEGYEGKIDFSDIPETGGKIKLVSGAKLKRFSTTGLETTEAIAETWEPDLFAKEVFDDLEDNNFTLENTLVEQNSPEIDLLSEGLNLSKSINPVQLYNSVQFGNPATLLESNQLEIIAYPGERLEQAIQEGDIVVRRALGEPNLGHVAVVAEANLWSPEEIETLGLISESDRPGSYARIIDEGSSPHDDEDSFARLIVDQYHRVPRHQILLRPKNSYSWEAGATLVEQAVSPAPKIRSRPCCILASEIPPFNASNIVDLSNIGNHNANDEKNGLIYSGKAGFLDLGHIRELCDLTKHVYDQIVANNGSPLTIKTLHGEAVFYSSLAQNIWLPAAMAIAYTDSVGYEIYTYRIFKLGNHHSSFSPEDLCSNFLGTIVARRAISTGKGFNTEVTKKLNQLIQDLDGQNQAESLKAFDLIKKRWVNFNGARSVLKNSYLRRRNFTQTPWKTGHSSDSPTPTWVITPLPNYSYYDYTHTAGRSIPQSRFASEITSIRIDAKKRYGANYDRP